MSLFALADCNNFFVSCERVFRPDLRDKPVVVLSNNDGCIIARSNEAKKLGLKMGDPYFKIKGFLERNGVTVFSSNYRLYGDMSKRVMSVLSRYCPSLDIYSVDECFMNMDGMDDIRDMKAYASEIVNFIYKGIGIPISIGVAPTKTLAKMASEFAKKYPAYKGVCLIDNDERRWKALQLTDVSDIWGVGRRLAPKLQLMGIRTAADLAKADGLYLSKAFNVNVYKTWRELNGESCIDISELPHNKSICVSRSFAGTGISNRTELEAAVAGFASDAAEKLRKQKCAAQQITVFAYTSRFISGPGTHYICNNLHLPYPTQDTGEIISEALAGLRAQYVRGVFNYKKAGIVLWDISPIKNLPAFLFDPVDRARQARLNQVVDQINLRNGRHSVAIAAENHKIHASRDHVSPEYTTKLEDIITLNC